MLVENYLPVDCRSNSYLDNYNIYLKKNLGRKYNLNWNIFITFLKEESVWIRNQLTYKTEKNFDRISTKKYTKFGQEKFTEKNFNIKSKMK